MVTGLNTGQTVTYPSKNINAYDNIVIFLKYSCNKYLTEDG